YMTIKDIRALAAEYIPTAKVKRKLFWRYLSVWQK
ncbi:MAG: methyltransferase type 11, partial [Clostridiaceae bacterium]|nr:methyltransferase type 11 [Clostridiaceae bacterium]